VALLHRKAIAEIVVRAVLGGKELVRYDELRVDSG